jgi:hypothetical protein
MRKYMQYLICQKKYPANSPQYFFLIKNKCNMERKHHMHGKIKPDDANTEKNSRSTCFFCLPQTVPAMLSQENRGHNKLVPRLHSKHTNITSKCASNQT